MRRVDRRHYLGLPVKVMISHAVAREIARETTSCVPKPRSSAKNTVKTGQAMINVRITIRAS